MGVFQNAGHTSGSDEAYVLDDGTKVNPRQAAKRAEDDRKQLGENGAKAAKTGLALELEKRRKENPDLVALARVPNGCRRATVLLAAVGDGTYQAFVINDDPSKLPPGKLRIHNLSPFTIAIRIPPEKKPRELKRNEQVTLAAPDGHVIYELAYLLDDEWNYQENNIVKVRPNEQTQMLVLQSQHDFFISSGGSTGGFLQNVVLRRTP